jgi:uncharacterized protein
VEPLYFGPSQFARFGVFHPGSAPAAARGVLLCYPLGHEYIRAHRAYRNLAVTISRAGLPTLRFDYLGSGDSADGSTESDPDQWQADIDLAIDHLTQRSGIERVTLIGLRFGATLAALASSRRSDIDRVILWDPALSGASYLQELKAVQHAWIRDRLGARVDGVLDEGAELLGMSMSAEAMRAIEAIDLTRDFVTRASRILIVMSSPRDDCLAWQKQLKAAGVPSGIACVPSAGDWLNPEAVHQLLLPHEILKTVAEFAIAP